MACLQQIRTGKDNANEYATSEDFCRIFAQETNSLYQLSFLLTGDDETAQQCFVAGLEDSVKANNVFREWAHSWAKRAIIENAIRVLRPQPTDADSSALAAVVSEESKLRIIRDGHLEIDSVLALEDLERFVYVITVLERYSDHDSALLLGCSIEEVHAARIRAVEEIARIACNAPTVSAEHDPQQLSLIESGSTASEQKSEENATPLLA